MDNYQLHQEVTAQPVEEGGHGKVSRENNETHCESLNMKGAPICKPQRQHAQ